MRWGDYPGLSKWVQSWEMEEGTEKSDNKLSWWGRDIRWCCTAVFEDGEWGHELRNTVGLYEVERPK